MHVSQFYKSSLFQKHIASHTIHSIVFNIPYDKYTKELVGYAINKHMIVDLVCRTLNMVIKNKGLSQWLIVHSDINSQYYSHAYYKIIKQQCFEGSINRKDNCFDNAQIERFWGVLSFYLVLL